MPELFIELLHKIVDKIGPFDKDWHAIIDAGFKDVVATVVPDVETEAQKALTAAQAELADAKAKIAKYESTLSDTTIATPTTPVVTAPVVPVTTHPVAPVTVDPNSPFTTPVGTTTPVVTPTVTTGVVVPIFGVGGDVVT